MRISAKSIWQHFPLLKTRSAIAMSLVAFTLGAAAAPDEPVWHFKKDMLDILVKKVPEILNDQSTTSGRFGSGIWMVNDQHVILPLAAAWATKDPGNPYYHNPRVLEAVMKGGDALIDDADSKGMWLFRKKDGSTWGMIWMPWTYSRWMRAYDLIKDAMPAPRRERWQKALILGYTGIADNEVSGPAHNIPSHHAMGLYLAGKVFNRPEWMKQASEFLHRTAANQNPDGYWSENYGPVVGYNIVYVDALANYYAMSHDKAVLPALERSARFHANFTYPDGSSVETIDERQRYYPTVSGVPNIGFSFCDIGRGYIRRQWDLSKDHVKSISAESAACYVLYGEEGPMQQVGSLDKPQHYVTQDGKALVHGQGPWFTCLSSYCCPIPQSRWMQDRQNLVSLFNEQAGGLILGGGNTKLTPLWSTFTVGDTNLLKNKGEEEPDFTPPVGLLHVPTASKLDTEKLAMDLDYDTQKFRVQVDLSDAKAARLTYSQLTQTTGPAEAHLPFWVQKDKSWKTASGRAGKLTEKAEPWQMTSAETGAWFQHAGWRVTVPEGATIKWPVAAHEQYAKHGEVPPGDGAIVMSLPFSEKVKQYTLSFSVAPRK